jgi:hypothetical protein
MSLHRRQLLAAAGLSLAVVALTVATAAAVENVHNKMPPTPGPDARPEDIVKALYDSRNVDLAFDYMSDQLRPRYFTTATSELLKKVFVRSEAENEPGIDYEPLIDGQDGEVKGLVIVKTAATPDKATVEARFTSFEDKTIVIFDFVNEKSIWKIEDIRDKEGNSLKAVAMDFLK